MADTPEVASVHYRNFLHEIEPAGKPKRPREPRFEEFLDMKGPADLTSVMAHVTDFTQREPTDGAPASPEVTASEATLLAAYSAGL